MLLGRAFLVLGDWQALWLIGLLEFSPQFPPIIGSLAFGSLYPKGTQTLVVLRNLIPDLVDFEFWIYNQFESWSHEA